MANDLIPLKIQSKAGCKRDGTLLEGDNYVDMQWCRFQMKAGLPRKIGGYRSLTSELSGISRGLHIYSNENNNHVHSGWSDGLDHFDLDMNGNVSGLSNRTPVGFAADANNLWQFDLLYDGTALSSALLAHAAPNANDISSSTDTPVYYGDVTSGAPLVASGSPNVAGGVFVLNPFGVSFGHDGVVNVSAANDLATAWTSSFRPTATKLVYGLPIRAGAGNGPSGLIWGIDALVRMTFVGGSTQFNFDTITSQYSILSSQSVIEYDGIFYWAGIDHFLSFNGVIQEVENGLNLNWFYDNLNYEYAQKVFAVKVPRWGEIWWCYPRGDATECTHAVILNVRLSRILGFNVWYDTELPNGGRSAGQFARVFRSPLMTGVTTDATTGYSKLWQHEFGVDEVDGTRVNAIQSYFECGSLWLATDDGQKNNSLYLDYIEPDFVQTGDMTVQVIGSYSNSRAPDVASTPLPFPDTATTADEQVVYVREQRRQLRLRFESNVQGGDYQMGDTILQVRVGDNRITS